VGQGDSGRQHQGRVIRSTSVEYSVTPVQRMAGADEVSNKLTYALRLLTALSR
jgi:hypothetical protein